MSFASVTNGGAITLDYYSRDELEVLLAAKAETSDLNSIAASASSANQSAQTAIQNISALETSNSQLLAGKADEVDLVAAQNNIGVLQINIQNKANSADLVGFVNQTDLSSQLATKAQTTDVFTLQTSFSQLEAELTSISSQVSAKIESSDLVSELLPYAKTVDVNQNILLAVSEIPGIQTSLQQIVIDVNEKIDASELASSLLPYVLQTNHTVLNNIVLQLLI
jgi:hypothetical protein